MSHADHHDEVVISVEVSNQAAGGGGGGRPSTQDKQAVVAECVDA